MLKNYFSLTENKIKTSLDKFAIVPSPLLTQPTKPTPGPVGAPATPPPAGAAITPPPAGAAAAPTPPPVAKPNTSGVKQTETTVPQVINEARDRAIVGIQILFNLTGQLSTFRLSRQDRKRFSQVVKLIEKLQAQIQQMPQLATFAAGNNANKYAQPYPGVTGYQGYPGYPPAMIQEYFNLMQQQQQQQQSQQQLLSLANTGIGHVQFALGKLWSIREQLGGKNKISIKIMKYVDQTGKILSSIRGLLLGTQ